MGCSCVLVGLQAVRGPWVENHLCRVIIGSVKDSAGEWEWPVGKTGWCLDLETEGVRRLSSNWVDGTEEELWLCERRPQCLI